MDYLDILRAELDEIFCSAFCCFSRKAAFNAETPTPQQSTSSFGTTQHEWQMGAGSERRAPHQQQYPDMKMETPVTAVTRSPPASQDVAANNSSPKKMLKVTSSAGSVAYFHIHDIRGDGDCGFLATGIARSDFTEKLVWILSKVDNTLTPAQAATVRALLTESELAEASRLKDPPQTCYVEPRYRASFERVFSKMTFREDDPKVFDDKSLVRFVTEVVVFECQDGEFSYKPYYASISDLGVMSIVFDVPITVFEAFELEFNELTPNNHLCHVLGDAADNNSNRTPVSLLSTGGGHFDRLVRFEGVSGRM